MSGSPVRISVHAEADLLGHYTYIAHERPSAAERFIEAFESAYRLIHGAR